MVQLSRRKFQIVTELFVLQIKSDLAKKSHKWKRVLINFAWIKDLRRQEDAYIEARQTYIQEIFSLHYCVIHQQQISSNSAIFFFFF